jgi:DNA-binding SARP family transcriptional activator
MAIEQAIADPPLYEILRNRIATSGTLHRKEVSSRHTSTPTLRLDLLGSPQVFMTGLPTVLRTRKTLALLAYLAIQGGRQSRDLLADLLWPEADIDDARASLRTTLAYIRHALGSGSDAYLATSREYIGLTPSRPIDLDVQAMAEAQQLVRRSPDSFILRHRVEAAAARYRGPFLADLSLPDAPEFEAWLEGQRAHWRGVAAELLEYLAALQLQDGDTGAALTSLERWTSVDPDEEAAWQQLIDLHLRTEDRAGARRAWQGYLGVLAELGADPSPKMTALAERIDAGPSHLRVLPSTSLPGWAHLDIRSLPFVGRSRESAVLLAAFERSRHGCPEIVVLEGATGLGKTRLIVQFSQHVQGAGADVLLGRALQTAGELPYAAVVDALRTRLDSENAPDDLVGDLWLSELACLLPELRERYPDLPVAPDDSTFARSRLFEAVARLGQAFGQRGPLVLCLDDAQWTDEATRDLLRYALRRWTDAGVPILLILAVRSEDLEVDPDLAPWLSTLERETPTQHLPMTTLESEDVVALLARLSGPALECDDDAATEMVTEFGSWLAGRTGGHPLSLMEAIRALLEEGVLQLRPAGDGDWAIVMPDVLTVEDIDRLTVILNLSRTSSARRVASGSEQRQTA